MRILITAAAALIGLAAMAAVASERPSDCSILNRPPDAPQRPEDRPLANNCITQLKAQRAIALSELGQEQTFEDEEKIARIVNRVENSSSLGGDGRISKDDLDYLLTSLMSWKAIALHLGDKMKLPAKEQDALLGKVLHQAPQAAHR